MFVTVKIEKPLAVCFHPSQNLFLNCVVNDIAPNKHTIFYVIYFYSSTH